MKKLVSELLAVARTVMADDLSSLQEQLNDLNTLSLNLDRAFSDFGKHFRMAGLDPEVSSQFELLKKAKEGLHNAEEIVKAADLLLKSDPEDKGAGRIKKDADGMVSRFKKHIQDAQKVVMTISKKAMPEALRKYSTELARAIKSRLVDPDSLEVTPWQNSTWISEKRIQGVMYYVIFRIQTSNDIHGIKTCLVIENSADASGVKFTPDDMFNNARPVPLKQAVEMFCERLRGWTGLKGEGEAIVDRAKTAQKIAEILSRYCNKFETWGDRRSAEITKGNTQISCSYRSNLPKEGAEDEGYSKYREMVHKELAGFRKELDPALKPFADSIIKIDTYDGEKSWIYTDIYLK